MTNQKLKMLERNLTRSAGKAKQHWVRGLVGHTETDQGFFSIESIPVDNPIRGRKTMLAEMIHDTGSLYKDHNDLKEAHEALKEEMIRYKEAQATASKEKETRMDLLEQRIKDIEGFQLD